KEIVTRKAPDLKSSISFEVLPEIKEYERTSTTVINAYVMPIVTSYLRALRSGLDDAGIPARLLLMQSNGGLSSDTAAAERPMNIIESGPAGGVVGAQALARAKALPKIITFDMGGTTAKASMVEDGEVTRASEYSVGAGIMTGSRLLTGAGYILKVPAIDLAEVGAGGGSLVWIDGGGALQIGPESAGAVPGPVCYDRGGETPTVTDANVLLGYINPQHLVGGARHLAVLDHRGLGGRAAHVEGDDLGQVLGARQCLGADDAACRSRFDDVHRPLGRRTVAHQAAVGLHQQQPRRNAGVIEAAAQQLEVARHDRHHIGVDDGGRDPFVFLDFRQHLVGHAGR
ncbi:MAG TPA: hydantoinase/oxoprolinase family protein, partial [Dongiaceae bacterium]